MQTALDCVPCLVRQSLDASRAVSDAIPIRQLDVSRLQARLREGGADLGDRATEPASVA